MDNSQLQTGDILLFHHKNNFSSLVSGIFSLFTDLIMRYKWKRLLYTCSMSWTNRSNEIFGKRA